MEKAGREKGTQWKRLVENKGPNGKGWLRKRDPMEKAGSEKGTQWRRLVEKKGHNGEGW